VSLLAGLASAVPDPALYPRPADCAHLHWAERFPGSIEGTPWRRVVEAGNFAFTLSGGLAWQVPAPPSGTLRIGVE
jgi:hypothetical protein